MNISPCNLALGIDPHVKFPDSRVYLRNLEKAGPGKEIITKMQCMARIPTFLLSMIFPKSYLSHLDTTIRFSTSAESAVVFKLENRGGRSHVEK